MASAARRWWRRCRRVGGYGALLALIGVALLVAVANQALPALEQHPQEVSRWLSERVGQPIRFTGLDARWSRQGPRFALEGLVVGDGERQMAIGRADLQVSIYSGLLPGMPLTELSVDGLSLTLHQDAEGRWRLLGLPQANAVAADPFDVLQGFGELRVQDAQLRVHAERWGIDHVLPRIDGRLRVSGSQVRGGVRLWSDAGRAPLDLSADVARDGARGRLWIGADRVDLPAWGPLLAALGVEPLAGAGRLGAWADLDDRRISRVQVQAALDGLRLRRVGTALPPVAFERAGFDAQWQLDAQGWQVSVPRGRFVDAAGTQRIDDFWMAGGERIAVEAARIDVGPLLALGALSNRLPAGLAAWVAEAGPDGTVLALEVPAATPSALAGSARLQGVGFAPVGRRPGLRDLGGRVEFDAEGGVLALDGAPVGLDWPSEFGPVLPLALRGDLALWRDGDDWGVGTDALAIGAPGLNASARFALGLQADGSRPTLDLAADLDDFDVVDAKRFWLQTTMKPPVRQWLDTALVAGRARGGRIALGGDLDAWPFRDGGGRFDARVSLEDVTLKFNEAWPEATAFSGEAVFNGPGMELQGMRARLLDTVVSDASGAIEDFKVAWLDLAVRGGGGADGLRALVMRSPLYAPQKANIDALSITGPAAVDLRLRLPLKKEFGEREVAGTLSLDNASVADSRWNVAFEGLSGAVPFTDRGFLVDALPVRYGESDGALSLRVGDTVRDDANVAELRLEAALAPKQLLDRSAELAWLEPWLAGRSLWDVRVDVPRARAGSAPGPTPPARLSLRSDLVGTRLGLPAPLRKSASTPLPLRLELPLPASAGSLQLRLGQLMQLRGRMADAERPFAAVAEFGSVGDPLPIPDVGIAVRGQVPSLDIGGWVAAAAGGEGGQGGLQSVDVRVGAIDVLDRSFGEGRVQLKRENPGQPAQGLWVGFDGPAIAGEIRVPSAEGASVDGRFARLHWPPMDAKAMTGSRGEPAPAVDQTDPSGLPPLRFRIEDFRLGEARLGRADLQTFPTPEGMHVDRFSTTSDALKLTASGDWTRIGGQTRSRFALDFDADSLGGMLDALGFTGMVEEGAVKARMVGDWPGSPGSFRLDRFDGGLRLDVGAGRLLDVEPGTGRFIGLVSIAEIPRRLTLDFSDFFEKGFAFNGMSGDFAFRHGDASTDNLRIDGPAAEINVSGTTALAAREYDQRIEVLPKAGGVLPALGAVTAGPAGAALGAMAQAVLQVPLKQATRTVYSVQGPWAQPDVDVVERGPRRPTPSATGDGASRAGAGRAAAARAAPGTR
jgi:uncharacterized protein (TIGR02099 family)